MLTGVHNKLLKLQHWLQSHSFFKQVVDWPGPRPSWRQLIPTDLKHVSVIKTSETPGRATSSWLYYANKYFAEVAECLWVHHSTDTAVLKVLADIHSGQRWPCGDLVSQINDHWSTWLYISGLPNEESLPVGSQRMLDSIVVYHTLQTTPNHSILPSKTCGSQSSSQWRLAPCCYNFFMRSVIK